MQNKYAPSEGGQVLVLIVLALVGMLGFITLAIDGGMIYSDRRVDQNAADAAAYAGASAIGQSIASLAPGTLNCNHFMPPAYGSNQWNDAIQAAVARAANNNFVITADNGDDSDNNLNEVWLTCAAGANIIDHVDVHVRISRKVSTSLVHLFNQGDFTNTVDSVVRIAGPEGMAMGASILALQKTCSPADTCLTADGTYDITVDGGNIITNSDFYKNGHSGIITITNGGEIIYYDEFVYKAGTDPWLQVQPWPPTQAAAYTELDFDLTESLTTACAAYTGYSPDSELNKKTGLYTGDVNANNHVTLHPGKYNDIRVTAANARLTLLPGLYCLHSLNVTSSGKGNYAIYADNVTFVMLPGAGDFNIGGDAYTYLHAMSDDCDQVAACAAISPQYQKPVQGLLLWSMTDPANGEIHITGSSSSHWSGSVLAPDSTINIGGGANKDAELFYDLQFIANEIKIHGTARINIRYDADQLLQTDTLLTQFR